MERKLILVTLIFFILVSGYAQINLKIGYDAAYANAPESNAIIDHYNDVQSTILNEPVQAMHWLHGINLGVRYSWGFFASEISFESLGNRNKAVEVNGNNGFEKEFYYRLNHLSLSSELIFGKFSLGASIESGNYKLQSKLTGTSQKKTLGESNPLTSKLFLSFNLKGTDLLGIVIRPYYRFHLGDKLSVGNLSGYLFGDNTNSLDNLSHFGINFSFYNGLQL